MDSHARSRDRYKTRHTAYNPSRTIEQHELVHAPADVCVSAFCCHFMGVVALAQWTRQVDVATSPCQSLMGKPAWFFYISVFPDGVSAPLRSRRSEKTCALVRSISGRHIDQPARYLRLGLCLGHADVSLRSIVRDRVAPSGQCGLADEHLLRLASAFHPACCNFTAPVIAP